MPRVAMTWNKPKVVIATTQAALDTAPALECQVTSAVLTPVPKFTTVPATGCEGESQSPGLSGWQLNLAWLQDWVKPADESLSRFAFDNDAGTAWVRIVHDRDETTDPIDMEGQFYVSAGAYGGTFGDGSAAPATATWPAVSKPAITSPAATP